MRQVAALTFAIALAGVFGATSADAQKTTKPKADRNGRETTTISGCLERNAYDQYVLVSPERSPAPGRTAVGTSGASPSSSAGTSTRYQLLLQKDLDLTQDVGKRVNVTGQLLNGDELRTDVGRTADHPVGTTGDGSANATVFGVVGVQQTSGACGPQASQR
jgi:hypothetical protein